MRIIIAPDKFKGSLSAAAVADHLARGITAALPAAEIVCLPIADGGEGTLDAALAAGFTHREAMVSGPTGHPLVAAYGYRAESQEAIIEMALASGLAVLPQGKRHALTASSRGTGELILAALDDGAQRIILGVGGSANTDGGAGMLTALGAKFLGANGHELPDGGGALHELERVDLTGLDPRLTNVEFVLASDVDSPLYGPTGAAVIFGPQKGATPADVARLDAGLERLADAIAGVVSDVHSQSATAPGAGAAGGVGYAAMAVLGATRRAGIDVVMEFVGLPAAVVGADLVIAGEGSLDAQSLGGKAPLGVAALARAHGVRAIAVCGVSTLSQVELEAEGVSQVYALTTLEPDVARSIATAGPLLEAMAERIVSQL